MINGFDVWRLRAGYMLLALAAALGTGGAARAQEVPNAISPLRVEPDGNGVNLTTGRIVMDTPVLSVAAAPNLRFDRVQSVAPYISGRVSNQAVEGNVDRRSYSVVTGSGASDSFTCEDFDCISNAGSGSRLIPNTRNFLQAGSGATWNFNVKHVLTTGINQVIYYYASNVAYPNGETITYAYEDGYLTGEFIPGRTFRRPVTITSNMGYFIQLTYQSNDFNDGTSNWSTPASATLYASAAPTVVLRKQTYGATAVDGTVVITDYGNDHLSTGREYRCVGCANVIGAEPEVAGGSTRLPGEGGASTTVAVHASAQVVGSVTRDGVAWTYGYTNLHQDSYGHQLYDQIAVTGPNGYNNVYTVSAYITSPASPFTPAAYANQVTRATDSIGRQTDFYYDEYHRVNRIVSPELNEVRIGYDARGNINWRTAKAKPGSGLSDITETAEFLPDTCLGVMCYRPTWSRDALGRQTDYVFNALGQLTEQTDPADANGVRRKTYITYATSAAGISRRSVVRVCGATTTCGTSAEIRTEYDYVGNTMLPSAERRIDAATSTTLTTTYSYDSEGRLTSTDGPMSGDDDTSYIRYDRYGRKTWEIGPRGAGGVRFATRTTYRDSDNKVTSTEIGTLPSETGTTLTVLRRTDLDYDAHRNPIRESLVAAGATVSVVQRSFDDRGRPECEARRMNPAVFGSLPTSACTPGTTGTQGPDRITRAIYDAASQRLQLREGVGFAEEGTEATWAYNANGQVATVIDGNGNRADLRYDGHGRQDRWTFPSATRAAAFNDSTPATALATAGSVNAADYEAYTYDAAGNRTSLRKRDGVVLAYSYDALNRMTLKTVPASASGAAGYSVHYGYDLRGLQTHARFGSATGPGITNVYDGFGRLATTTTNLDGVSRSIASQYDARGNRTAFQSSTGHNLTFTWDGLDRMREVRETGPSTTALIGYGANGQRASVGYGYWGNITATIGYSYDTAGRLTGLSRDMAGSAGDQNQSFDYNPAGGIAGTTRSNDAYAWTGHYATARPYTTNGLNQYTAAGSASFTYDANGNLTSDGATSFVYDAENRLVSASGARTAALAYDPLGRLWQVTAGGGAVTRFVYDGDRLLEEYDGAGTRLRVYAHGPGADEPFVWYELTGGPQQRYLYADHQGSIVGAADANGNLISINTYDEYGIPGAGNTGRFQYTGQAWLAELGMYYYKARIYSPTLGRFMQTDPVGYEDQYNLYGYVGNDPVNRSDPTGLAKECTGSRIPCPEEGLSPGRSGTSSGGNRGRNNAGDSRQQSGTSSSESDEPTGESPFYFNGERYLPDPLHVRPWFAPYVDYGFGVLAAGPIAAIAVVEGGGAAAGPSLAKGTASVLRPLASRAMAAGRNGISRAVGRTSPLFRSRGILNNNNYARIGWGAAKNATRQNYYEVFRISIGGPAMPFWFHFDF